MSIIRALAEDSWNSDESCDRAFRLEVQDAVLAVLIAALAKHGRPVDEARLADLRLQIQQSVERL